MVDDGVAETAVYVEQRIEEFVDEMGE